MTIDKNCLNCGAKLHKDDILCLECETPVLTEDDITLMPNAAATRVLNELEYNESPYSNPAPSVSVEATEDDDAPGTDTVLYIDGSNELIITERRKKPRIRVPQRLTRSRRTSSQKSDEPGKQAESPKNAEPQMQSEPQKQTGSKKQVAEQKKTKPKGKKKQPKKSSNRTGLITIIAIILIAAAGIGIFYLLQPPSSVQEAPEVPLPIAQAPDTTAEDENTEDPVPLAPLSTPAPQEAQGDSEVTSIVIYRDGRAQTELHTMLDEIITLRAQILPEGSATTVTWESSDPDVLEIISYGPNGMEASVVGKIPGVADIIVSSGGFEMSYIVFVDDFPFHKQLESAVKNKNEPLWLMITWTSGMHNGEETVFEWDVDNQLWIMEGAYSRSEPEPVFGETSTAFTIGFSDAPRVYYFYADGTGHYRNPDGSDNEDFIWFFLLSIIEPEG